MSDQSEYPVAVPQSYTYAQSAAPANTCDKYFSPRQIAALVKEKSPCTECQRARKGCKLPSNFTPGHIQGGERCERCRTLGKECTVLISPDKKRSGSDSKNPNDPFVYENPGQQIASGRPRPVRQRTSLATEPGPATPKSVTSYPPPAIAAPGYIQYPSSSGPWMPDGFPRVQSPQPMSPEQDARGENMVVHVAQGADMRQSEQSVPFESNTTIYEANYMHPYGSETELGFPSEQIVAANINPMLMDVNDVGSLGSDFLAGGSDFSGDIFEEPNMDVDPLSSIFDFLMSENHEYYKELDSDTMETLAANMTSERD